MTTKDYLGSIHIKGVGILRIYSYYVPRGSLFVYRKKDKKDDIVFIKIFQKQAPVLLFANNRFIRSWDIDDYFVYASNGNAEKKILDEHELYAVLDELAEGVEI